MGSNSKYWTEMSYYKYEYESDKDRLIEEIERDDTFDNIYGNVRLTTFWLDKVVNSVEVIK